MGEHLPYKQRVTGSSPVAPTIKTRQNGVRSVVFFYAVLVRFWLTLCAKATLHALAGVERAFFIEAFD